MVIEADRQINLKRSARISPGDIATDLGTSRSLVYSYFPDLNALIVAVLDRHADLLSKAGIERAVREAALIDAATECATIYLRHVLEHGSAIELCFREKWLARHLDGRMKRMAKRIIRQLATLIQRELEYGPHDALGVVQILLAIPEEGARLVRNGEISLEMALALCRRLTVASLEELRPQRQ